MEFGVSNRPICEPNPGSTLPFPPPSLAVSPLKASPFSDSLTDGEGLNVGNVADDGEVHAPSSLRSRLPSIRRSNVRASPAALHDPASAVWCMRMLDGVFERCNEFFEIRWHLAATLDLGPQCDGRGCDDTHAQRHCIEIVVKMGSPPAMPRIA